VADFTSFAEFTDRLQTTRAEHHFESLRVLQASSRVGLEALGPPAAVPKKAVFEAEFAKMTAYLRDFYFPGMECAHTYLDANGNFVDCVPVEQQPTARKAAADGLALTAKDLTAETVPLPPRREVKNKNTVIATPVVPPLRRGLRDPFGNRVHCPEGCVPIRRITPSEMSRCGTFDRFFSRVVNPTGAARAERATRPHAKDKKAARRGRPVPPAAGNDSHRHAVCESKDGSKYFGCATWLNLWKPNPSPGVFSLSQLWMHGSPAANGNPTTIESGWTVYPSFPGLPGIGNSPVIFVFYNPDGYRQGGANGYVGGPTNAGFVRFAGSGWPLMSALPASLPGADNQVGIQMTWVYQDGSNPPGTRGWYLYIGQDYDHVTAVGYFPAANYSGALASNATRVQFGGEVAAVDNGSGVVRFGPMGSGVPPTANGADNFGKVAFQADVYVQTVGGDPFFQATLGKVATTPSPYKLTIPPEPEYAGYFFFGGSGG
jgi:hypothetical protein